MQKNANADWVHVRMKMMDFKRAHAAPLVAYADQVAAELELPAAGVPYPDPEHGGTAAEVLFLLSHAGENAIRERGGSGLLSLENNDIASRNCFDQCERVGLDVERITHWNAVPQPLPKGDGPKPADVRAGARFLPGLIELLPKLRVVVLLGRNPEMAWDSVATDPGLARFEPVRGPSPGSQGVANRGATGKLAEAFDQVMAQLG